MTTMSLGKASSEDTLMKKRYKILKGTNRPAAFVNFNHQTALPHTEPDMGYNSIGRPSYQKVGFDNHLVWQVQMKPGLVLEVFGVTDIIYVRDLS